jgi:hypothetical protein
VPKLFVSNELPDYFVEVDFSRENRESGAIDGQIADAFENGQCVVFKNWLVDFDAQFFSKLDFHENREAKKLKSHIGDAGTFDRDRLAFHAGLCAKNPSTAGRFATEAERVGAQVVPIVSRIFSNASYLDRRLTWRMLETVHEDLHIDVYGDEKSDFQIRMFVNLDVVPRIWHTGYTLEEMLDKFGHFLTDGELAALGPTVLCKLLNQRVYGGPTNAGQDGQPRHTAFFYPGEVWMVDSRRVAHQIFYGRRALSVDFLATAESMRNPDRYYLNSVERYRRDRGISLAA